MTDLQSQIREWAMEAVRKYDSISRKKYDCAFYHQSDLTKISEHPQVVIMGINPGSVGSYTAQIDNDNWGIKADGEMTPQKFIQGNPFFKKKDWSFIRNMRKIFRYGDVEELLYDKKSYVYTNLVPFNTAKAGDLPKWVMNECAPLSLSLIGILRPKLLVCLGVDTFDKIMETVSISGSPKPSIETIKGKEIVLSRIGDVCVLGIYHPNADRGRYYTDRKMFINGVIIRSLLDTPQIVSEDLRKCVDDCTQKEIPSFPSDTETALIVERCFNDAMIKLGYSPIGREGVFSLSDDYLVSVRHEGKGQFCISRKDCRQNMETDSIMNILYELDFESHKQPNGDIRWLGCKRFKAMGMTPEKIAKKIVDEVKLIAEYEFEGIDA
ncbi:MAG: hypothetical protein Q4D56_14190 [Bacteroides sp.]|nr:hypothetical protein [Bacteroides sp.]